MGFFDMLGGGLAAEVLDIPVAQLPQLLAVLPRIVATGVDLTVEDIRAITPEQLTEIAGVLPRTPEQAASLAAGRRLFGLAATTLAGAVTTSIVSDIRARQAAAGDVLGLTPEQISQLEFVEGGPDLAAPPLMGFAQPTPVPSSAADFDPVTFVGAGAPAVTAVDSPSFGERFVSFVERAAPIAAPIIGGALALGGGALSFAGRAGGAVIETGGDVAAGFFGLGQTALSGFFGLGQAYLSRPAAPAMAPAMAAVAGAAVDPFAGMFGGQNLYLLR